ncbi:MAG TPA: rhodanese-like domain-containing protein [Vicinamibacterales bacterium]|jgi:rhodanese-related sulfurtransferase|nr:rhodanese-like domain-containing protein [Vicinamibacterales bacterium]
MKLAIMILALAAQLAPSPDGAPRITQKDFKALVAAGRVIIVDTRNADAYAQGHIPGAILLPLEGLIAWPAEYEKTAEMLTKAKTPVVTYCA